MTLTEFLAARLDEDEAVAREASPGPWHLNAEHDEVLAVDDITVCEGFALSGPQTRATTEHIARHDPARVLADVKAKRGILAIAVAQANYGQDEAWGDGSSILFLLAQPYADHPDFDPAWRTL